MNPHVERKWGLPITHSSTPPASDGDSLSRHAPPNARQSLAGDTHAADRPRRSAGLRVHGAETTLSATAGSLASGAGEYLEPLDPADARCSLHDSLVACFQQARRVGVQRKRDSTAPLSRMWPLQENSTLRYQNKRTRVYTESAGDPIMEVQVPISRIEDLRERCASMER